MESTVLYKSIVYSKYFILSNTVCVVGEFLEYEECNEGDCRKFNLIICSSYITRGLAVIIFIINESLLSQLTWTIGHYWRVYLRIGIFL